MLTDEQINIALESLDVGYWDVPMGSTEEFARLIEAEVRKEIEAAVLAEREACAQLADKRYEKYGTGGMDFKFMANAIRARTQPMRIDAHESPK